MLEHITTNLSLTKIRRDMLGLTLLKPMHLLNITRDSETISEFTHWVEDQICCEFTRFLDNHFRRIWSKPHRGSFSHILWNHELPILIHMGVAGASRNRFFFINNFETLFIDIRLPLYQHLSLSRPCLTSFFLLFVFGSWLFLWTQFGRSLREKGILHFFCFHGRFSNSLRVYLIKKWAQVFEVICVTIIQLLLFKTTSRWSFERRTRILFLSLNGLRKYLHLIHLR